jgi:serine protease
MAKLLSRINTSAVVLALAVATTEASSLRPRKLSKLNSTAAVHSKKLNKFNATAVIQPNKLSKVNATAVLHPTPQAQSKAASAAAASSPRRVWITYTAGQYASVMSAMQSMHKDDTTMKPLFDFPSLNSVVTMATDEEIAAMMADPNVEIKIADDPKRFPSKPTRSKPIVRYANRIMQSGQSSPYGNSLTQVDQLRAATGLTGAGVTVCVIDSGFDLSHEDFQSSSYTGESLIVGSEWTSDTNGHGTHVTGIIAAADNDIGVVGVAPDVGIHVVDVFGNFGFAYASALIDAAYSCRDAGAKVISMSLGGPLYYEFENAVFTELLNVNGILSVAAAGNSGDSSYSFPASYDNVLSVGAVDEFKQLAFFSQFNDRVNIVAPGVGVLSTLPASGTCEICTELGLSTYGELDGTSQATPFVSGIAALLWSSNPSLPAEDIRSAMLNSALDLGTEGRDDFYGNGLISALSAYDLLTGVSDPNEQPPTPPPASCVTATLSFVTDQYPFETFTTLTDLNTGIVLWEGGADLPFTGYSVTSSCLDPNGCYEFLFLDSFGDGICCEFGAGSFDLSYNGASVLTGDTFGSSSTFFLGDGCSI